MNAADILVIPRPSMLSAYFGFPSKLCEYMAAGKLIIATDISPHRWALENPRSGMLCKPNAMSLARAIMDYDPSTARQLGQTAQEQALRRFDYQKQCRLMLQAFEKRL